MLIFFSRLCLLPQHLSLRRIYLLVALLFAAHTGIAGNLVIAEKAESHYQVVIPDQGADEVVDRWLSATAHLMQTAFLKNQFTVEVVRESQKDADKHGIYLGATQFAKQHGIEVHTDDWTYVQRVVGDDIVIVGTDRKDTQAYNKAQPAQLGTVKGAVDFMRDYLGVRFLFLTDQAFLREQDFNKDGTVVLDTRAIGFMPVDVVQVPTDLDIRHTPPINARQVAGGTKKENFYTIAMNHFPKMKVTNTNPSTLYWNKIISLEKYGETHPEYFALMPNGKRAPEIIKSPNPMEFHAQSSAHEVAIDPTHPEVQQIMVDTIIDLIEKGEKSVLMFPLDSLLLVRCTCDRCNALFGMTAMNEKEVRARSDSNKAWQIYFAITEKVRKKYPDVPIIIWDYHEHRLEPSALTEVPANVMPQFQIGTPWSFDLLEGIKIPMGITGLTEDFTGFQLDGPYAPEKTPNFAARMAKQMMKHHVKWVEVDGGVGFVPGLQAPAYYVFGRMFDNPHQDWEKVEMEFYEAAFKGVEKPMIAFFDLLHDQIEIYSDYLGEWMIRDDGMETIVARKLRTSSRRGTRRAYWLSRSNKWFHKSIYSMEFLEKAEALLSQAEKEAMDPDVKVRLQLIRIDFDYVKRLGEIYILEDAWKQMKLPIVFNALLDKIDEWRGSIEALAGGRFQSGMQPLKDWPQMRPFRGTTYDQAILKAITFQSGDWRWSSVGWDTEAIRSGALERKQELSVAAASDPDIEATTWETAIPHILLDSTSSKEVNAHAHSDMPLVISRTELKMLHDKENLYVRVHAIQERTGNQYIQNMQSPTSKSMVMEQEYLEVWVQPKEDGPAYRFAFSPVEGKRYEAKYEQGKEDTTWNGDWESHYQIKTKNTVATNEGMGWVGWVKIPYKTLGVDAPKKGTTWKANVGRKYRSENSWMERFYMSWVKAKEGVVDSATMGTITFQ